MNTQEYLRRVSAAFRLSVLVPGGLHADSKGSAWREARQRALAACAGRSPAPLWTEEPETCDVCGRRLLTGERPGVFQRDDGMLLLCPLCAIDRAVGGQRVVTATGDENGSADGGRHLQAA